jgi:hypothetical protein
MLEGGRRVGETKEHDSGFEEAFVSVKRSLPLMAIFDPNIVVAPSNIKLCEDVGLFEFVNEIGDEGKGIGIVNSMFVDILIVLTRSESSIFLFDKEEGGGLWQVGRTYLSSFEVLLNERLCGLTLFWGQGVGFSYFWDEGLVKVDLMIIGS